MSFINDNFMLKTETAKKLYAMVKDLPIIDYHCHLSPKQIAENYQFKNAFDLFLGGDHYKWRQMRSNGIPEELVTGDADEYEKFRAFARTLPLLIGNPLYHWTHLELKRYFDIDETLNEESCERIWNRCNECLAKPEFRAQELIRRSNVEVICTTDDPIDTLEWHEKLAADPTIKTAVLPAWRPDKAMNLEKPDYIDYLSKLSKASGVEIRSFADLKKALADRMEYFAARNCVLSDHGLNFVAYAPASDEQVEAIFAKRLAGDTISSEEQNSFKTAFMLYVARQYRKLGWIMQLHYGCRRDNNPIMYDRLGPDTGYDTIDNYAPAAQTAAFLGALEATGELPKTILYSLNPNDNQAIDTICGCFQSSEAVSKMQHGSAWWFNDHFTGMTDQLSSLASLGYLAGFVGMLTDSRSFLSYPRHEYFRRILCRLLGQWVEEGMFPDDMETLKEIVRGVSYENAKKYFSFAAK